MIESCFSDVGPGCTKPEETTLLVSPEILMGIKDVHPPRDRSQLCIVITEELEASGEVQG